MKDYMLARAWAGKGRRETAIDCCRRAVVAEPTFLPAWRLLAELLLLEGQVDESMQICSRYPQDPEFSMLAEMCDEVLADRELVDQPGGRFSLLRQRRFAHHRSGWAYALQWLRPLHHQQGVLMEGFIESSMALARYGGKCWEGRTPPYLRDWVGFMHNPMFTPDWWPLSSGTPQSVMASALFQDSLPHCRGLYALTDYMAVWLREQTGLPVQVVLHPSEFPERQFCYQRFLDNPQPKIIQIGWWLRRLSSIFRLPIYQGMEKIWLVPARCEGLEPAFRTIFDHEGPLDWTNVRRVVGLPNAQYDDWLSQNLAFVHLYDASANNAVVECIARATPLLVNPLPPVMEYLGPDYPFYFETLEEAAEKAQDRELVRQTHEYLLTCPARARLTGAAFLEEIRQGEIYRALG